MWKVPWRPSILKDRFTSWIMDILKEQIFIIHAQQTTIWFRLPPFDLKLSCQRRTNLPLRVCVCACSWSDWILLKYIFLLCSYMFTKRQDIRCIHFHVIICYWYQHWIPLISQPVNFTKMHVNVIVKENKEKSTVCNEHKVLSFFYSLLSVTLKVIQSDLNQIEVHPNVKFRYKILSCKFCINTHIVN